MRGIKRIVLMCIVASLFAACEHRATYEKLDDGILLHIKGDKTGANLIKLQVISSDIVRVVATPTDSVSKESSLVVLPEAKVETPWSAVEEGDTIKLSTASIQVYVSLITGAIRFADSAGTSILREKPLNGRRFEATTVENEPCYKIQQVFESPSDEAFYGLGGHQNGQMNYKGQDVELAQHNIVDVIPFLYSSKNYGLLWDNYSITKFGDPRDYQQLNSLTLFSSEGEKGGLTTSYYVGDKLIKKVVEDNVDYEFLETPQVDSFPKDVARNGKVIWEGSFSSEQAGSHKFLVYASGYFKVWVDGKLLMDKWRQGWNPWSNKFIVDLKQGERHQLKLEWTPDGGGYFAVKHLDPFDVDEQSRLSLTSEVGCQIDYYFVKGNSADKVIDGYRRLTGKAPIVPKWAMGFWQSRERYRNQQEIIDVVSTYRKRNIPLDNIVLDWQYWEDPKWGTHEFDHSRFPDPRGMLGKIHELHANLMISVWPKFNKGTDNYEEMNKRGFLFTRNIEKGRKDWVGIGYENTFYNPFKEDAGKLFWKQIDERLNVLGIDAWWLDATEPDMHSNLSIEERKLNMSPTGRGPGAKYFNAYSLLNSKSVYEGQRKSSPEKRVFILTRSAFAGQQRYGAATWSGDIVSRWSDFKDQLATGINFSLSGIPYWTMDIGGFAVEHRYEHAAGETLNEWRELNARWFQFGAFCPIFRSHGQFPFREIYNVAPEGHEVYNSMVYYDKLRYHLLPYVYSLAGAAYFDNSTIMRGLIMDFPQDPGVRNVADQYMFGPSILVNPVYSYLARSRSVYLPKGGGWFDFYTGKYHEGGENLEADAPLGKIPLFIREGSILPFGPAISYTSEKKAEPTKLFVFTGRDAHFDLYDDEGVNYNYERGKYATIPLSYDEHTGTLTLGSRKGFFDGIQTKQKFEIVWVNNDHPVGVDASVHADQVVEYDGKAISIQRKL